jgi:hypothetical protein
MAKDGIFKDREKGLEEDYFRKSDAALLEKMRAKAALDEVASELGKVLQVENPELVRRVLDLGIQKGTGAALLLAPLVQVAWAEGKVTDKERDVVLRFAASRGVDKGSPAEAQLLEWLEKRPSDAVFAAAIDVIKDGLSRLPANEREERVQAYAQACREVSEASGGLAKALGVGSGVSSEEQTLLDVVVRALRSA